MAKKNLDKIFQDRLNGFTELPDERVWERIEKSLDRKKKKRRIPIWWYMGGAAAILVLAFLLINPAEPFDSRDSNSISDVQHNAEEEIVPVQERPRLAPKRDIIKKGNNQPNKREDYNFTNNNNTIAVDESDRNTFNSISRKNERNSVVREANIMSTMTSKYHKEKELVLKNSAQERDDIIPEERNTLNSNQNDNRSSLEKKLSNNKKTVVENDQKEGIAVEEKKKSIYEAIVKVTEDQGEVVQRDKSKRWSLGPAIAPVYFGAIGEGSPIHSNFIQNRKSGNLDLSYGLKVAYQLTDKLTIRSGVHRVDYGYDTNDISFTVMASTGDMGRQAIANIDYKPSSEWIIVNNRHYNDMDLPIVSRDSGVSEANFNGSMTQQMGYLELPVELSYALLHRKFGISLIGGISSLILINDSVSLESGDLVTELGGANNLNNANFSTNIGLGLDYRFSNSLELHIEPIFKYQLNTFSNIAGDFNPYTFGVYSGINFRF